MVQYYMDAGGIEYVPPDARVHALPVVLEDVCYGLKLICCVTQVPFWPVSVQSVMLALRLCPAGLYPNGGELTVVAPPETSDSIVTGALQPSLFEKEFASCEATVFVSASLTLMDIDRNAIPLLLTSRKSIHQTEQLSIFSKEAVKLVGGGGAGER